MFNRITKIVKPIVSQSFATKNEYVPFVNELASGNANKEDPKIQKFLSYAGEENCLADKQLYEKRAQVPFDQRPTLTYEELREYENKYKELSPEEQQKVPAPLQLTGGKGRSLSLMDGCVDVPPGFNVTTAAYFQFVRDNEKVYKKIQNDLSTLDTMDDQKRDVVTREIRETIINGVCPENIKSEILAQYRDLCFKRAKSGKQIPTTVAVRSSGTKEDIKVESWLPITTGSQAGQSDTFLNCKGEKEVLEKLQACWASLFTDRAVSYRDDAIFLIFSALIGFEGKHQKTVYHELVDKIKEYGKKLNNPKMLEVVETLEGYHNAGSANMVECMQEILKHEDNPLVRFCLTQLKNAAQEVVHPEQIGIDVVIMQMVQSYIAGVLFTVNPPTRNAGASLALYNAWYKNDKSLCHTNKDGEIHGTKPLIVSFEAALGYGENVVGGKVDPDRFVAGTYNGQDWFILEKKKGSKLIQMINVDEALRLLSQNIPEEKLREIANMTGKVVGYEEVGKQIRGVLTTHLYGLKYFAPIKPNELDNSKKQRLGLVAYDIADLLKKKTPNEEVVKFIQKYFKGIQDQKVAEVVELAIQVIDKAKEEAEAGKVQLAEFFGDESFPSDFVLMLKETWENNSFKVKGRKQIMEILKVQQRQFVNISYLIRSLIDKTFTCNMLTEQVHRDSYCITDEVAKTIARMAWKIGCYYEEKQDIEFAIEIDPTVSKDVPQRCQIHAVDKQGKFLKVNEDGTITKIDKPRSKLVDKDLTTMMLYNVQARPYTAPYSTIDFVRERVELVEELTTKLGQPIARGTLGDNATVGYTLVFDPNKTIDQHADIVKRLKRGEFLEAEKAQLKKNGIDPTIYMSDKTKKLPVVLYLLEADPSHDPLMRLVDAVVTIRGGETCHAAIFCREQGIPAVSGAGKFDISIGDFLVVNAIQGRLYKFSASMMPEGFKFDELLVKVRAKIKPYLIPFKQGDTKCGYILAAEQVAQQLAPTMLARDAAGIALSRAEFKGEELGINVVAGYAYDFIIKMKEGTVKRSKLTKFQKQIVEELEKHPWIIDQIRDFITNAGYYRFSEYIENGFYYFQNNLGFNLAPDQVNKARAYDFAQDKVQGLIGSEVFSWRGINPLVGLRGASLEIKDVKYDNNFKITEDGYQEILGFLLKASCNADRNTHNQGWFYVFIRTERELKVLANILRRTGKALGHLPSEIGIMVEVPSNALFIEKLGKILLDLQKDTKKYGVKKVFFSFGTNDYTNLAGKTDREDPRIQNLRIMDPVAKKSLADLKKKGFFVDQNNAVIPLALEGADILTQLVEHVCAFGRKNKIDLSLCGQAIVKLVEMGLPEQAGKIMSLLNSFGVDPKNRLNSALLRYDSMRLLDKIKEPGNELFKLSKSTGKGVVSGELVFVDCDEDLMPDSVKGLEHGQREAKLKLLGLNKPKDTTRVGDKIAVITGKLSNLAAFDKKHIDCLDLQYCRAILIAPEIQGWEKIEVFDPKKSIAKSRVKGFAPQGIKDMRSDLEGKTITIDYKSGVVYDGELEVEKIQVPMRTIAWTTKDTKIPTVKMTLEKANDVYAKMKFHPGMLLAYRNKTIDKYTKTYDDHARDLFEDGIKITEEKDTKKKAFLTKNYQKRVEKETGLLKKFFTEIYSDLSKGKSFASKKSKLLELRAKEFKNFKQDIEKLLGKKSVEQFITGLFKENMEKALKSSKNPVVHSITTLNCVQLAKLQGGFLVEQVNPNPDYGLLGAARALSDLWEINRWELKALKEVRQKNKNIHLQISDLKGVQSGALVHLWMKVLNDAGLVPGKNGLEVGCNISTAADTLACVDYMKSGLTFFTFDKLVLGACWGGVDIYWDQWDKVLARRKELEEMGEQSIKYVKSKMEQINKEGKYGQKKLIQF